MHRNLDLNVKTNKNVKNYTHCVFVFKFVKPYELKIPLSRLHGFMVSSQFQSIFTRERNIINQMFIFILESLWKMEHL